RNYNERQERRRTAHTGSGEDFGLIFRRDCPTHIMSFWQGLHAVRNRSPQTVLPQNAPQSANLVVRRAITDACREPRTAVFRDVIRVYVANETLSELFLEMRHALLVALMAFLCQPCLAREPHVGGMRKQRHTLAFRDAVVGLLQLAVTRFLCFL